MKKLKEQGYQAILFKGKQFDVTPISKNPNLSELVAACEKAKNTGIITHYIIRYVYATYEILSPFDLGVI